MTKLLLYRLNQVLTVVLTVVALTVGQRAWAF